MKTLLHHACSDRRHDADLTALDAFIGGRTQSSMDITQATAWLAVPGLQNTRGIPSSAGQKPRLLQSMAKRVHCDVFYAKMPDDIIHGNGCSRIRDPFSGPYGTAARNPKLRRNDNGCCLKTMHHILRAGTDPAISDPVSCTD